MNIGDEDMCNIVSEVLLELEKPSTVSEIASKANVNEGVVQHALITLKENTGFVERRDGKWFISGSQEDNDKDTYPKVSEQERELNRTEMRSKPPERGTHQTVSSLAEHLGNLELRPRLKRGAASSEKSSPEDKLQSRLMGQNERSVVPYMDRSISKPHVTTVGSSNLEIETRQPIQIALLSDPDVREVHVNFNSILTYLKSKPGGATAVEVSKYCNLGNSKSAANPLLFFLAKKQLVHFENIGNTQKKIWTIGPNFQTVSEQQLVEFAAERKKESGGSSAAAKSGTELHFHSHLHKHEHKNYIQVGDNCKMVTPQVLEEHERCFERSAEDQID